MKEQLQDEWKQKASMGGHYTMKYAYGVLQGQQATQKSQKEIWKTKVPPKVRFFFFSSEE